MKRLLYTFGIRMYGAGIVLATPFSDKAKKWRVGRRDWAKKLQKDISDKPGDWIWFHCSSLGEFEQGRPLIEAIKQQYPEFRLLLTFFSPSGYEVRKNYPVADLVCYLPLDTPKNAARFLDLVKPRLAFFVKYDLWLNVIAETKRRNVPMLLVSALLRKDSKFLKSALKSEYLRAFRSFAWVFTQNDESADLLRAFANIAQISVTGDTRFDRVAQLPLKFEPVPGIAEFIRGRRCIVAGSPWPKDEAILLPTIAALRHPNLCWIIAPHEIHPSAIDAHIAAHPSQMAKFSALEKITPESDVLWIDNVGLLGRLYHYSALAYIGGGFGAGIHNTQEAAVYGNPVIFGPNFSKFQEAVDLVASGGAKSVASAAELQAAILFWLNDSNKLALTRADNCAYMLGQTGATEKILSKLVELGLLPRT
jgi:3-deoxy-D-manno-octulosonic-acid transferase